MQASQNNKPAVRELSVFGKKPLSGTSVEGKLLSVFAAICEAALTEKNSPKARARISNWKNFFSGRLLPDASKTKR